MKTLPAITIYTCLIIWPLIALGNESGKIGQNNFYDNTNIKDTIYPGTFLKIDTLNLTILPPSNGVQFYRDGIIYSTSTKSDRKVSITHQSFGKIDVSYSMLVNSMLNTPVYFSKDEPFIYPCDAVTFSSDFNKMYYTKYSGGSEKIYEAVMSPSGDSSNNWLYDTIPLDFCTENYAYNHPALSSDGQMLVFSSNKSDSEGGMDLFLTLWKDNKWEAPTNIGSTVNSVANESYPFIDEANNLYFSSDRPDGLGGYDIYFCQYNGVAWNDPENLSVPVNTTDDDIAFTINKKDPKTALYSVRHRAGNKRIQVLSLTLNAINTVQKFSNLSQMFISEITSRKRLAVAEESRADITTEKVSDTTTRKKSVADSVAKQFQEQKEVIPKKVSPAREQKEVIPKKVTPAREQKEVIPKKVTPAREQKEVIPKSEVLKKTENKPTEKDIITYRVQIKSAMKTKGSVKVKISDVEYDTYDYFYKGAYRTCVGLFRSLPDAVALQNKCRKSGFPQAFVVAFKNNTRSTDPALFRR